MRTKTLLITAALSLAGVATSMAQVYSVNAVGYINLTLRPGFNLVANQLNRTPNNSANTVITGGLDPESQLLKYINNPPSYDLEFWDGTKFVEADGTTPGNLIINPGEGFFLFNSGAANATVTLVGEVPQGATSVPIPSNFSAISSVVPQALPLTAANGFPQTAEAQYISFNATTQNYDNIVFNNGGAWVLADGVTIAPTPTPAVGQGFFYFNPEGPTTWNRTFSVN
jgi:hypothetical protein